MQSRRPACLPSRALPYVTRFSIATLGAALFGSCLAATGAFAQTAQPLPNTVTTLAGSQPMSAVSGTACPNLPGAKSTDSFGDGCLAVNAIFGSQARGGVQVDAFGNVFVADDVNSLTHVIDPVSGIIRVLAGGGAAVCTAASGPGASGAVDSSGDGCIAATQTKTSSPRGIGLDAYGNVLLGGYGDNAIHVVCRAASPLCTSAQVGTMQLVAGCVRSATSAPSGGVGADNVKAVQTFVTAGCTAAGGEVDAPRGASGDQYGNVFFADTSSSRTRVVLGPATSPYFTGTNPLYAALGIVYPSLTQGFAYSVVNVTGNSTSSGGTATTRGASCSVTAGSSTVSGTALDTLGDGCPFNASSVAASSGYTSGVAVDGAGNMLFTDPTHGLRVFFVSAAGSAGAQMRSAIQACNPGVTPQPGFIYLLWGGGATPLGAASTLGTATAATDSTLTKLAVSPLGNIFIGDYNRVVQFDTATGYVRQLFAGSANIAAGSFCMGSSGPKSLSAYSDGCPAANSLFSNSSGLGLSLDASNNLYLFDAASTSRMLVRKVLAQGFAAETLNASQAQTFAVHLPAAGGTPAATATLSAAPDLSTSPATCSALFADSSFDCYTTVTATPTAAGARSGTLTVTAPAATLDLALNGSVSGSVLAFNDGFVTNGGTATALPPSVSTRFNGIVPAAIALDGAGNLFALDSRSGHLLEALPGGAVLTLPVSVPAGTRQIAVNSTGDLYLAGSQGITELAVSGAPASTGAPLTYTATPVPYTPLSGNPSPQSIAVDSAGNLFVADQQSSPANTAIFKLAANRNAADAQQTVATGFSTPVSVAVDPRGNVFVADKGAGSVVELTPGLVAGVPGYAQSAVAGLSGAVPAAVTTDAAGDLYVQDQASGSILEVPVSGAVTPVVSGVTMPAGLQVGGQGTLYSADLNKGSVDVVIRDGSSFNFGTNQAQALTGTLTNVGTFTTAGQDPVTNTTNFLVTGGVTTPCTFTSSVLGPQAPGNACTLTASFVGAGSGTVTDRITYLPAGDTLGSFSLTGTLQGTAIGTTTTIGAPSPANPVFSNGGTEVTFNVTVAAVDGSTVPGGTVAVTVDSKTTNYTLTGGTAIVAISGVAAGAHTIFAAYSTSGSFSASSSGAPFSFNIAQDTVSLTWKPETTTGVYSTPVGTAVLNASAIFHGLPVAGTFVYTANSVEINAASYLPIGSYTLAATFVPVDATDFAGGTIQGGSFSVTKATTTAALGLTQRVVAADGTGNYTSVQSALNALPTNGGSIYVKPGTYIGFVTVNEPNVSIYGLGGDPTKVVLTNEDGAFSPPFLPGQGYGNNGSAGDQGSATMVVARGTVNGSTANPSNFYAENFTIANTYDTSTTTTTTNALVGGTCTPNQPAQTLANLFNAGTECNSQALAIWITSDQAVLNNIYTASEQDTIYAGAISGSSGFAARQYWFRGKVTGDVDYVFGDAAAVFDRTSIYSVYHSTATGTDTIEAQNKADQTGGSPDYLSGYVMNNDVFTSQSAGMSNLYFGRPYGKYSTWIMLNSLIDQVNPLGYTEFQGTTNLPTSTYVEYNDMPYTDPATGSPDANGVTYLGTGGSSGAGVTGVREATSQDPGTPEAANTVKTSLTQAQAQAYYPIAFLGQTVPTSPYNSVTNWDPTAALAFGANAFVPSGNNATVVAGASFTLLMRPQTPGLGAITNGQYTIPTGTYALTDNGGPLASGTLDAAGEASFTSASLLPGTHTLAWSYSGDSNFAASTSVPFTLNIPTPPNAVQLITTTTLSKQADGSYLAAITITNNGSNAAAGVTLGSIAFGNLSSTPGSVTLGTIGTGQAVTTTVTVPAAVGASGSRVIGKVNGTYVGGSFGGSLRVVLP